MLLRNNAYSVLVYRRDQWQSFTASQWRRHGHTITMDDVDERHQRADTTPAQTALEQLRQQFATDQTLPKQLYILLPSEWLSVCFEAVGALESDYLLSLASLALASEMSHLAPEKLYFSYYARPCSKTAPTQLNVYACPARWAEDVESWLAPATQFSFVPLIRRPPVSSNVWRRAIRHRPLDDCIDALRPYQADFWQKQTQKRYLSLFVGASVLLQILVISNGWLQSHRYQIQHSQYQPLLSRLVPLGSLPKSVPLQDMGHQMLAQLPLSVRLNRLQYQANQLHLSLTGPTVVLEPLMDQWRDRWPELTYVYHHDDDASWLNQRPSHQENRDVIIQFHSR